MPILHICTSAYSAVLNPNPDPENFPKTNVQPKPGYSKNRFLPSLAPFKSINYHSVTRLLPCYGGLFRSSTVPAPAVVAHRWVGYNEHKSPSCGSEHRGGLGNGFSTPSVPPVRSAHEGDLYKASHDTFHTLAITRTGPTTHSVGTFVRRTVVAYHQNSDLLAKFWLCAMGVRFMGIATLRAEHDARSTLSRVSL